MMIPIRCFSCGALIAHKYSEFVELVKSGMDPADALDKLNVKRYCCRRMILSHVEIIDLFLKPKKKSDNSEDK